MPPKKTLTFEERLRRLQEVVATLENSASEDLSLEDSVRLYKEGLELSRSCREQLEKVRNEVRLLTEDGSLEPFASGDAQARARDEHGDEEMEDMR